MITEQIILGIYILLLLEVAFILFTIILIIWNIKKSFDAFYKLINKFTELGHITIQTAENFKDKLNSLSTISSVIGAIPEIVTLFKSWSNKTSVDKTLDQDEDNDDLGDALAKVASPKKKRRII
jgi:hypothetical protein